MRKKGTLKGFWQLHISSMCDVSPDERAVASSDYDSTYDSTYETNHSDSSDFAQNEEEGEGGKKPPEAREGCRECPAEGIVLHPLLTSLEVGSQAGNKDYALNSSKSTLDLQDL